MLVDTEREKTMSCFSHSFADAECKSPSPPGCGRLDSLAAVVAGGLRDVVGAGRGLLPGATAFAVAGAGPRSAQPCS